jgi:hypothetical protein
MELKDVVQQKDIVRPLLVHVVVGVRNRMVIVRIILVLVDHPAENPALTVNVARNMVIVALDQIFVLLDANQDMELVLKSVLCLVGLLFFFLI